VKRLLLLALLWPALALGQATRIITSDSTTSCTLGAANAVCVLAMVGKTTAGFVTTAISSPTGMTLVNESSRDGTNWDGHPFEDMDNGDLTTTVPNASLTVGTGRTMVLGGGVRYARVRVSTWTSGSVTVAVTATDSLVTQNFTQVGNSSRPTYLACTAALANTGASEAMACEAGASKSFRVRAIWLAGPGSQTTAAWRTLTLKRTTAAGSAGTAVVARPLDEGDSAFSGTCRSKGTAGTAGVTLGTMGAFVGTATTANLTQMVIWPPPAPVGTTLKDIVVAAGTANGIAIADTGAAGGANMFICMAITEE
jgi:hypothetical protein